VNPANANKTGLTFDNLTIMLLPSHAVIPAVF
jgi:hypothetical protein